MKNQHKTQELEQQIIKALEKISKTLNQKQIKFNQAQWQKSMPSLEYLLNNLSDLPWSSITPDNLKINYLSLTAVAEFYDKNVSKKLFSQNEKLKYVYLTFDSEGITISEKMPDENHSTYSIKFNLKLVKENKVKFLLRYLEFDGIILSPEVVQKLKKDYNFEFKLPKIPYNLKIISIFTVNGKLIVKLKK